MQPTTLDSTVAGSAMRVRQNVAPAAIGTAFLLYFGFFVMAEPTGWDVYHRAAWVLYHTLRLGGLAMGAIAIWCILGQSIALVVDAVITVLIGSLLILTGLAMKVDGGDRVQTIINVVCGGMFISSGVRNWKEYRFISSTKASKPMAIPRPQARHLDRTPHALPNIRRTPPFPTQGLNEPTESQTSRPSRGGLRGSEGRDESRGQRESTTPIELPPEGFLASLAKKPPPTDDEGPST